MRTQDLDDRIFDWIANGGTLRSFCRLPGSPSFVTVYEWRKADKAFGKRFDLAREIGGEQLHEEMLEIADTPKVGEIVTEETVTVDGEAGDKVPATKRTVRTEDMLGHRKLQLEAREKLLKVWFPEKFSAKATVDHKSGGKAFDDILRSVLGDDKPEAEGQ